MIIRNLVLRAFGVAAFVAMAACGRVDPPIESAPSLPSDASNEANDAPGDGSEGESGDATVRDALRDLSDERLDLDGPYEADAPTGAEASDGANESDSAGDAGAAATIRRAPSATPESTGPPTAVM